MCVRPVAAGAALGCDAMHMPCIPWHATLAPMRRRTRRAPQPPQGMAGNIIHAIATTNAIVSGLIVIEALKLLAGAPAACQTSFLHQQVCGG